ncbi:MAG TPA: universal stress protein [Syntrophales bacterium]|nr:universal stress protein [Syntrophales bacterium]HOM08151.1 universal stress protein [Syntrophales bacterium]HOO00936.1 universal stress protein [Syntrophales bacterium]
MFKKILYPTAFERYYQEVLECITNLKKVGTEEIVLLHVIYSSQLPQIHEGYILKLADTLRHLLNLKMKEAAKIVNNAGINVKGRIELGIPHQEILRVAEEEKVSLIVCGREHKGALGEIFIGSITDRIIRYGTIPVYVPKCPVGPGAAAQVNAFCQDPFRRILYPTDWSDCARNALQYLKSIKDAPVGEVVVAHVMDEKAMKLQPEERFREFERVDLEKLQQVKEELEKEGFIVKTLLQVGNPRAELIRIARQENISLIVMGTHGKGRMQGILWGSVSRNTAEYSESPILLIKGQAYNPQQT